VRRGGAGGFITGRPARFPVGRHANSAPEGVWHAPAESAVEDGLGRLITPLCCVLLMSTIAAGLVAAASTSRTTTSGASSTIGGSPSLF
jgi:hypothetical protein